MDENGNFVPFTFITLEAEDIQGKNNEAGAAKPNKSLSASRHNPPCHAPETRAEIEKREAKWARCDAVEKAQKEAIKSGRANTILPENMLSSARRAQKRLAKMGPATGVPWKERQAAEQAASEAEKPEQSTTARVEKMRRWNISQKLCVKAESLLLRSWR